MPTPQRPATPAVDLQQSEIDALRLRAHAVSARLAIWGSLAVALLLLWVLVAAVDGGQAPAWGAVRSMTWLLAWLAALAAVVGCRLLLSMAHRRWWSRQLEAGGQARPDETAHWLRRYRWGIAVHGLVWGLSAWLALSLADWQLQTAVVLLLVSLVVGAITLTLFDLVAAWLFALPVLALMAARLAWDASALAPATLVALAMGGLLLVMLSLAGRRAARERHTLARARRAERDSARHVRDAQSLLQQVFDHAGQGISVFDTHHRLLAWNDQVAGLAGLAPEMLRTGVSLADCVRGESLQRAEQPPIGPAEVQRRVQVLTAAGAGTLRERRRDGRMVELRHNPLPDGGLVLFHVDITEREAHRRAADEQRRVLDLVLAHTAQGFWYIDNDLRTTDANPAMCAMLGLDRAQLLGRSIYEFVDAENRAIFEHHVALRATGQAGGYEITLLRADGAPVHCFNNATPVFDAAGRKTGALGLFSDISAQKAAERQIRQASDTLAAKSHVLSLTLDSLVQGVLNVDPQGRCIAWNRRFLEMAYFPATLMTDRPLLSDLLAWQLRHGEFGDQLERLDDAGRDCVTLAQQGTPISSGHIYRRVRADGTVLDVASHFAADGSMVRTYTDVTASVAAERALIAARDEAERAREEAEAANRAKSDFLSRMSHELRTPLNAILGFAQLMQADVSDPPSAVQRQRLEALVRGGQHLLALINDVLDVARIEAGSLQLKLLPVDLGQLVQESLALVQPMTQARKLQLQAPLPAPDGGPWVTADATRLRQVLLNLLSNAIKFNREAGAVQVRWHAGAAQVRLEVADEGAGIPPDQLPRLFQAFERLGMEGAVEGTGIGLALSRSLVTLMHGEIGVASTPGQGSVFWVQLPASAAPAVPPAPPPMPAAASGDLVRRRDVLYIEDNEVNQVLMQGMLAHRPAIDLRLALLPEAGLAMAQARAPDLVLLDIQLPGMDGYEVLKRLRLLPALRQTPVVAVSANAMPDDLARARDAGFADYLTKPLDMTRLLAVLDRILH